MEGFLTYGQDIADPRPMDDESLAAIPNGKKHGMAVRVECLIITGMLRMAVVRINPKTKQEDVGRRIEEYATVFGEHNYLFAFHSKK